MKAIIVAGGLGTRLRPLTDKKPKPFLPVKGKPMLEYAIENLQKYGISDIILAICYHADQIMAYFKGLKYSVEKEPLGTGGAIKQAAEGINEDFLVVWGDNLMDIDYREMIDLHNRNNALVTMALTPREDVEHFGVAKLEGERILEFIEKPSRKDAPSNLINAGAFVVNPKVLEVLPEGKSSIERDCFEKITSEGKVYGYIHKGQWFPTDTIEKYELAKKEWKG